MAVAKSAAIILLGWFFLAVNPQGGRPAVIGSFADEAQCMAAVKIVRSSFPLQATDCYEQ